MLEKINRYRKTLGLPITQPPINETYRDHIRSVNEPENCSTECRLARSVYQSLQGQFIETDEVRAALQKLLNHDGPDKEGYINAALYEVGERFSISKNGRQLILNPLKENTPLLAGPSLPIICTPQLKKHFKKNKRRYAGLGVCLGLTAVVGTITGIVQHKQKTNGGNTPTSAPTNSPSPTAAPTPPVPARDNFSQQTETHSAYNRSLSIRNDGTEAQSIKTLSFLMNTPLQGTPHMGFTLTSQQLPAGYYAYTLNAANDIKINPGELFNILNYVGNPSDQNIPKNFPSAIAINPMNVTATFDDNVTKILPVTDAKKPVPKKYKIKGSFSRAQYAKNNIPSVATDLRLNTIVIRPDIGIFLSTEINGENLVWSSLQTDSATLGMPVSWGLVGDCSNNPDQIPWDQLLSNPLLKQAIAKNAASANAIYGNQTPFSSITIDTVGCNIDSNNLLNFLQQLRANVGTTTPINLVTAITGPTSSIVQGLINSNIEVTLNTAGGSSDTLKAMAQNLMEAGMNSQAISVGIPAKTDSALLTNYDNVIHDLNLAGPDISDLLTPAGGTTANFVDQQLNTGNWQPVSVKTWGYQNSTAAETSASSSLQSGNIALFFLIGAGLRSLVKWACSSTPDSEETKKLKNS